MHPEHGGKVSLDGVLSDDECVTEQRNLLVSCREQQTVALNLLISRREQPAQLLDL